MDIRFTYINKTQTITRECLGNFKDFVDKVTLAKRDGVFCRFENLAINPDQILYIENITNGNNNE